MAKKPLPPFRDLIIEKLAAKVEKKGGILNSGADSLNMGEPHGYLTTGIYALDVLLSRGRGIPYGRIIELFGQESGGKTAFAEFIMGLCCRARGTVHYIDTERTRDDSRLKCYGVKPDDFLYPDLETLDDVWDYIYDVLKLMKVRNTQLAENGESAEPVSVYVVDSVAASPARDELDEAEHGDSHVGLQARANAKGCRKVMRELRRSDAIGVFVNQIRDKIGSFGHGPKTDTPGGRAIKFAYSIRLKLARVETLKKGESAIGQMVEVTSVKNKHAPYPMKCKVVLSFMRGIDPDWSNFLWFQSHRKITAAGKSGYKFDGSEVVFKRSGFGGFAATHTKLIEAAVKECTVADLEAARVGASDG
jgi:recombination protein RecA